MENFSKWELMLPLTYTLAEDRALNHAPAVSSMAAPHPPPPAGPNNAPYSTDLCRLVSYRDKKDRNLYVKPDRIRVAAAGFKPALLKDLHSRAEENYYGLSTSAIDIPPSPAGVLPTSNNHGWWPIPLPLALGSAIPDPIVDNPRHCLILFPCLSVATLENFEAVKTQHLLPHTTIAEHLANAASDRVQSLEDSSGFPNIRTSLGIVTDDILQALGYPSRPN